MSMMRIFPAYECCMYALCIGNNLTGKEVEGKEVEGKEVEGKEVEGKGGREYKDSKKLGIPRSCLN